MSREEGMLNNDNNIFITFHLLICCQYKIIDRHFNRLHNKVYFLLKIYEYKYLPPL